MALARMRTIIELPWMLPANPVPSILSVWRPLPRMHRSQAHAWQRMKMRWKEEEGTYLTRCMSRRSVRTCAHAHAARTRSCGTHALKDLASCFVQEEKRYRRLEAEAHMLLFLGPRHRIPTVNSARDIRAAPYSPRYTVDARVSIHISTA